MLMVVLLWLYDGFGAKGKRKVCEGKRKFLRRSGF